ncbi:MAG TPA: DUF6510 family protein [Gaiellaceae bacterium]|jgi:hypothetical protein
MDVLKLDGNAAAGILQQVFAVEVTTASGTCAGCGATEPMGAVAAYMQGPGLVLRCPHCEAVLVKAVTDDERVWLDLRGLRTIELRV